ncbi:MAG: FtsW/RodA/SpoVE family cell cycle protein [Campylobacterota bacterium]|nr:FtsW/RodA/SpoVE family cell cycle protein [Campylobacterota bacterium]
MKHLLEIDTKLLKNFNLILILQMVPLWILSAMLIKEINPALYNKQMIYYTVALVGFFVAFILPWRKILWWFVPIFYTVNLGLLISVEFIGKTILGAKRWVEIPGIGITVQPSEFMKVSVLMMLAYLISRNPPSEKGYGIGDFTKLSIVILIPFLFIAKEPDLGTALVLLIAGYGVLFIVGVRWQIWAALVTLVVVAIPSIIYPNLHDYQKKRINDFLNKPSYHVQQSLIAIGSGGVDGNKKDEATQTQLKFLPISTSDFIFAYLGERFGFIGMILILMVYILLILHLLFISSSYPDDYLIQVFASGTAFLFFVYMTVNIYMIIGLAPVVGLPLPMFSHGGTSFIIFAVIFGILQNLLAFKDFLKYNTDHKTFLISKKRLK